MTNHFSTKSSIVKWFFRMFMSLFVKNEYHQRVFREKIRSTVITLYIWQRETCPLAEIGGICVFWQQAAQRLSQVVIRTNVQRIRRRLTLCSKEICSCFVSQAVFLRAEREAWSEVLPNITDKSEYERPASQVMLLKSSYLRNYGCVRRARKFRVPSAKFLGGVRYRPFAKNSACLSQVRRNCRVYSIQRKYAWKLL